MIRKTLPILKYLQSFIYQRGKTNYLSLQFRTIHDEINVANMKFNKCKMIPKENTTKCVQGEMHQ